MTLTPVDLASCRSKAPLTHSERRELDGLEALVRVATLAEAERWVSSAIGCCRYRRGRPCTGYHEVCRARGETRILWWCRTCGTRGRLIGWAGGRGDRSAARAAIPTSWHFFGVSRRAYDALRESRAVEADELDLVYRARVERGRIFLFLGHDEWERLYRAAFLAAHPHHEGPRGRSLAHLRRRIGATLGRSLRTTVADLGAA